MRTARLAGIVDCCCVLAFVIIGRANHADGLGLSGVASTAWPFLAGLFLGWTAVRAWRRPAALAPAGLGAWLGAAGLGMVLRVVAGQGTAGAFVGVALAFLGLFLLGWRLVFRLLRRLPGPAGRRRVRAGRDGLSGGDGLSGPMAHRAGCNRPDVPSGRLARAGPCGSAGNWG